MPIIYSIFKMELYLFMIIFIMLFIFNDMWGTQSELFTMENIGPFNPDGYGDRGVYFDRSGLKPRMFHIFPDTPLPKKEVKLPIGSDVVSEKKTESREKTTGAFYSEI
jgi:hypothetical protein